MSLNIEYRNWIIISWISLDFSNQNLMNHCNFVNSSNKNLLNNAHYMVYNNTVFILLGHLSGDTHSFRSSSIMVPAGHSHPLTLQIRRQPLRRNLLAQVVAHPGGTVQFFRTCPLTGHVTS